jgi:hypothetical protein
MAGNVSEKIDQFIADTEVAHQIIHGDNQTLVTTEGGPVRTFAKIDEDARQALNQLLPDLEQKIEDHEAKPNPHDQYVTVEEFNTLARGEIATPDVQPPGTVEAIKTHEVSLVKWIMYVASVDNPRKKLAMELLVIHDGTDSLDATMVDYTGFGSLKTVPIFEDLLIDAVLVGAGIDQQICLRVASSVDRINVRVIRAHVVLQDTTSA